MATTMNMAESSVEVHGPVEKVREKWNEWTKTGGPGMGMTSGKGESIPQGLENSQAGTAYFEKGSNGSTNVRMELRYNPNELEKAGQGPDWVEQRISLYLTRFKNFAEGRPA